jgi:bifunctional DNase/RNase
MSTEVEVVGVRIEMPSNQPIVLLKELNGSRFLPIWVGANEATAIAFAQQGLTPNRPLSHDLMQSMVVALGAKLVLVEVTHLDSGVFYAQLSLERDGQLIPPVSARPSDAIALALRANATIKVATSLLDEAGINIPESSTPGAGSDQEVERFREFLDQINPDDFAG